MRDNGPVSNRGVEMPANTLLVSRTDLRGHITFANDAFVRISGFSLDELVGKSHNIVRHKDMPPAAFADLWSTIQAGQCWVGVVKNRCKNGDHYWVRATVSPFREHGAITGYISVRTRPDPSEIAAAEAAYARLRAGDAGLALWRGRVRRRGLVAAIQRISGSMRWRLAAGFLAVCALLGAAAATGVAGMGRARAALETMHADRVVPCFQLGEIAHLVQDDWRLLAQAARGIAGDAVPATAAAHRTRIETQLAAYLATYLTAEESAKAGLLQQRLRAHFDGFVAPALDLLAAGRRDALQGLVDGAGRDGTVATVAAAQDLVALQERVSAQILAGQRDAITRDTRLGAILAVAALVVAMVVAASVIIALGRRLGGLAAALDRIAAGERGAGIDLGGEDEVAPALLSATALQTKITYAESSERESRQRTMADFDHSVGCIVGELGGAVQSMESTAQAQSAVAQQVSGSASGVAGAATELSASIKEIASQAHAVSDLARQAAAAAQRSQTTMEALSRAAAEITGVAKLIADIAGQTNLLALNATIEAARAGEVGRGFAVVAGEVKSLATQTQGATGDISLRIATVQDEARAAVEALAAVAEAIGRLTDASHAIAAAVEEQAAVVDDVARNAEHAAAAAGETGSAAQAVAQASASLSSSERALREAVIRFTSGLGA